MHSAALLSPKDPAFSVSVGVAALILEGRPNQNHYQDPAFSQNDDMGTAEALLLAEYTRGRSLIKDAAQRINQKLQQIRTCPGTSKEYVENASMEIPIGSPSHHLAMDEYAGAEKLYVNPKFRSIDHGSIAYHAKGTGSYIKPTTRSLFKTVEAWTESNFIYHGLEKIKMLHNRSPIKTAVNGKGNQAVITKGIKKKPTTTSQGPVQGPHCDQFLKKIGLVKVDPEDDVDHKCEYLSDMCRLWQANLTKLTSILMKKECICIEVYLGPENHAILLEQWNVRTVERADQPLMSLQSLCSAIRSQLYFSQITAWTDHLNNLPLPLPREVLDNPRIVKNMQQTKAKLDILFRIRSFNADGCFVERPQVHQFPGAIITDTLSVQVCLKSLPRMGKIPILNDAPIVSSLAKVAAAVVDDRKIILCTEKGKHRCVCDEDESPIKQEVLLIPPGAAVVHREKQLQKYKKRMMKRDKCRKREESDSDEGKHCLNRAPYSHVFYGNLVSNNKSTQTLVTSANTVGTQTEFVAMDCGTSPMCDICGNSMHMVCFYCDNKKPAANNNFKSDLLYSIPSEDKSELLLSAIERTGHAFVQQNQRHHVETANCDKYLQDNNNSSDSGMTCESTACDPKIFTPIAMEHKKDQDCRLCKRQKTRHHAAISRSSLVRSNINSTINAYANTAKQPSVSFYLKENNIADDGEMKKNECDCSVTNVLNLTELFEKESNLDKSVSSRTVSNNIFNSNYLSPGCSPGFQPLNSQYTSTPVQKSCSAPSFNYSTLSPRFCRLAAAMYKRRSRHLSDRSSTSEEPLSDDESYCDGYGRSFSAKIFSKVRKPTNSLLFNLCGTLEESLLQHRLLPKHQIVGFKVLLGASGSFCPTQLTVPAISNFYELQGNSGTSPYVSEVTLPRKGYCIPRNGTIQVTLINPLGTVVRMFVVPYDFSDMPCTSVTFIRQRILARGDTGTICTDTKSFNKLSSKDQMRLLRYAIHLRFKTSRSGRLYLHTDLKMLILRRPDCDTAAAHANNSILESPNELNTITVVPENPRYSERIEK